MELKDKRVTVTGGGGFLGSYIVEAFQQAGAEVYLPRSKDFDLVDIHNVRKMIKETKPAVIVHAAANVGGIGYNRLYPADIFFDNVMITGNVLKVAAETTSLEKLVIVGSACAYPGEVTGRLKEHQLLSLHVVLLHNEKRSYLPKTVHILIVLKNPSTTIYLSSLSYY